MSDVRQLVIEGELTIFTAADIRQRLLEALDAADAVEVNLSGVSEMDTAGLQVVLAAQLHATNLKRAVDFTSPSQAVNEVMASYGLTGRFPWSAQGAAAAVA